jgi:hypothetical protein
LWLKQTMFNLQKGLIKNNCVTEFILVICEITCVSGGTAEWLTLWPSNLRIADREGSNPVRGKPLIYTHY